MGFFARIGRVIRGFFGLFVSGLEERNPEALLQAAKDEFREKMAHFNEALARMAGIAERLKNQIKAKTAKAQDLQQRILANHRAGNLDLAGSLARELQELQADLATDTQELAETEAGYQANLRQAKVAQKDFEDKISRLDQQMSQVKVKEAQAEAAAGLSNVAFSVGDLGDTMKDVQSVLDKRYELSSGKARLAADLATDTHEVEVKESERKALEQSALADFLASQGIAAPTAAQSASQPAASTATPAAAQAEGASAPAAKEIGPG